MATLGQVVYDVKEALKDYVSDSELDNRYIIYLFNIKREKFLKQRLDRLGRKYNNATLQTFCVGLEEVSTAECGVSLSCDKIIRTVKPLPNFLQLSDGDAIQRVGPADKMAVKYNLIGRERATLLDSSNYPNKIKAFLHDDGYIYLISSDTIYTDCLSVTGVFRDPTELADFSDCCNCDSESSCYDIYETEYPLDGEVLDAIRSEIIKQLAPRENLPEDINNNSQDD